MKKKFIGASLALISVLGLASCTISIETYKSENDNTSEYKSDAVVESITSKEYDFVNTSDEYTAKKKKITGYFINNSDILYVDAKSYIESLDGIFDLDGVEFINDVTKLTIKANNETFEIEPEHNKITMSDSDVLNITSDTEATDYMSKIQGAGYYSENGKERSYDLSNYEMNIFKSDDKFLVPFSIMNDFYGAINYYNLYFNYDKFYGTFPYIDSDNAYADKILTSHKTQTTEMRNHNYNNLAFIFENFYGLKSDINLTTFDSFISATVKKQLLSTKKVIYNKGYTNLINYALDEAHSYIVSAGYDGDSSVSSSGYGPRVSQMISEARAIYPYAPGDGINYSGDTAIITFESFDLGTNDELFDSNGKLKDDAYEHDTFYLFKHYLEEIRSKGYIKNVVFDISLNGGGYVAAEIKCLGFLTNENIIMGFEDSESGAIQVEQYKIDTDCDDDYTDSDAFTEFNYYVLTSGYTYSAANEFATYIKENKIGKVIGRQSGGGKCSILPLVLYDGTTIAISSTDWAGPGYIDSESNKLSVTAYEYGIKPDITLELDDFYDWEKIDSLCD